MSKGNVADEYWNALNAAYMTAQDVYNDMNSTQKEINLQVKEIGRVSLYTSCAVM